MPPRPLALIRRPCRHLYTTPHLRQRNPPATSAPRKHAVLPYSAPPKTFSQETQAFLRSGDEPVGMAEVLPESEVEMVPGAIKAGMVVEMRRSGTSFLGTIICTILSSRRIRHLVLRSNGELLPISPDDVQFILPRTLIPQPTIAAAFTGVSVGEATESELKGRRAVVRMLRGVEIALEGVSKGLKARNEAYDPLRIWEHFSSLRSENTEAERWADFTLDDAITFIRASGPAADEADTRIQALAIFRLLMDRSDLFLGDETQMRTSQRFSLRPRAQIDALRNVQEWYASAAAGIPSPQIETFCTEISAHLAAPTTPPQFSDETAAIISIITRRILERRSTQRSPVDPLVPLILRSTALYGPTEALDLPAAEALIKRLGLVPQWDSFSRARVEAAEARDGQPPTIAIAIHSSHREDPSGLLITDAHESLRRDFSDLEVYVIDSPSAQELDDGLSVQRCADGSAWVHVHIADPSRWVAPGGRVARRAAQRGETLYYPEGGRGMIDSPGGDVVGRMSLRGGADGQPTVTFSIKLSPSGAVLDREVQVGMVRNVRKMSYAGVDRILGRECQVEDRVWTLDLGNDVLAERYDTPEAAVDSVEPEAVRDLTTLHELAKTLRRRRLDGQGFDYQIPTPGIGIVPLPIGTSPRYEDKALEYRVFSAAVATASPSADMVAEFMVLAGRVAGSFASDRGLALPFRGTTKPYIPSYALPPTMDATQAIEAFYNRRKADGRLRDDMYDYAATGIVLQTAPVSITPLNHWALGIHAADGGYSRVTSPLRRYSDMLAHWQIKQSLLDGRALLTPEDMLRSATFADRLSQRIKRMGTTAEAYWQMTMLQWIHSHPASSPLDLSNLAAKVYEAPAGDTSLGITDKAATVYIPELRVMANMEQPLFMARQVGEDVRVKVTSVQVSPTPRIGVEPL